MEAYHSDPAFLKAMQAYLTGDREDTLKLLETMQEKSPDDPSLLLLIGNTEYTIGRLSEAAAHYEQAIELSPGFCQAYYKLGVCYVRMGKLVEALQAFRKNVDSGCAGHVMSYYWMGLINNFLGKDDEALEAFSNLHRESKESRLALQ